MSERGITQNQMCLAFKKKNTFSHVFILLPKTGSLSFHTELQHELPTIKNVDIFRGIGNRKERTENVVSRIPQKL